MSSEQHPRAAESVTHSRLFASLYGELRQLAERQLLSPPAIQRGKRPAMRNGLGHVWSRTAAPTAGDPADRKQHEKSGTKWSEPINDGGTACG